MVVLYDGELVDLTPRFVTSLEELMLAKMEMMSEHDGATAYCWTWGRCTVVDLARRDGLEFCFGGEEDRPDDGLGKVAVVSELELNRVSR